MRLTQSERDKLHIDELLARDEVEVSARSRLMLPALDIRRQLLLSTYRTTSFHVLLARPEDIETSGLEGRLLGMELRPSIFLDDGEVIRVVLR